MTLFNTIIPKAYGSEHRMSVRLLTIWRNA